MADLASMRTGVVGGVDIARRSRRDGAAANGVGNVVPPESQLTADGQRAAGAKGHVTVRTRQRHVGGAGVEGGIRDDEYQSTAPGQDAEGEQRLRPDALARG